MPAAAVIPAPIAYIKVAAVKKLVVEHQPRVMSSDSDLTLNHPWQHRGECICALMRWALSAIFTSRKLECFKQAKACTY